MATTIEQQVALDKALVPSTQRLRIGRSNFRLPSDIQSKESTLQLVYDVLRRCPFFKAFLMNNKKHVMDLESFGEMLHICLRIPGQAFDELPLEEETLEFIRFLRHVATIRTLIDININKLYQPWRSFAAIINKCLTGKSSGYDSLQLSHAQILDNSIFLTIKVLSRHQNTQQYDAMLPIELTNDEIRNTKAYIEYYACATGEATPKPKASARRKRSGSDTSITLPTATTTLTTIVAVTLRLTAAAKGKQPAKAKSPSDPLELGGSGTDEGTGSKPGVLDVPSDESEEELSWNSSDDEGDDDQEKVGDDDEGDEKDENDDREEDDDDDKDGDERDNDDDDDDDDEQEIAKINEQDDTERGVDDDEETESDEESDGE
nr:hypothetical protein [Tanacetum cinerariifolium]